MLKFFYISAGMISLGLGVLGFFLPLLPTTPFVLLTAYFFSRSSKRMHEWLISRRVFGPVIRDWEENRIISLKAKIFASFMMVVAVAYLILFKSVIVAVKIFVFIITTSVLVYIWNRPSYLIIENIKHQPIVRNPRAK
ncbi:MAG: YbaN family protein [Bdellovibrionales bacterium]|nr:YbaN family protein [Bdellovibrionales bacterium]